MTFKGQAAEVRWGYHPAAQLGAWSLERKDGHGTFRARIVSHDEFRMHQQPLVVVVPGQSQWRWPLTDVQMSGSTLTARVG